LALVIRSNGLEGYEVMGILKSTVLAGIGFASLTKQKAEELVDTLIKAGELNHSDKKTAVMELLERAETEATEVTTKLSAQIEEGLRKISPARKSDLEALALRVDKLAEAVANLEKKIQ